MKLKELSNNKLYDILADINASYKVIKTNGKLFEMLKILDTKIHKELNKRKKGINKNSKVSLIFSLSMPSINTWNGHWSGENKKYTVVRRFRYKNIPEHLKEVLDGETKSYSYDFGDGWKAAISVRLKKRGEKPTNDFLAYDWMVESIIEHNKIVYDGVI